MPVELVTIGPKTNIMATMKPPPKIQPQEDKFTPPPPIEVKLRRRPSKNPKSSAPEPGARAARCQQHASCGRPQSETPQPPKPEKPKKFDINNIEALLNKVAPAPEKSNAQVSDRTIKGIGQPQNAMTMDLVDALRNQVAQCWSPPAGAPRPEDLVVDFYVTSESQTVRSHRCRNCRQTQRRRLHKFPIRARRRKRLDALL